MAFAPTVVGSGLAGYTFLKRTEAAQKALLARTPEIARETERFAARIQDIQTSDQLMADRALRKVALGAFGLIDDLDNNGFIKKILDSDLNDPQSLANRLADKRYLALAQAFNFAGSGGPSLPKAETRDEIATKLAGLKTVDDLLSDRSLLRASLEKYGLADQAGNTYFLEQVLKSDLSDATSFVNRLSNPDLVAFAKAFDFAGKSAAQDGLTDIAAIFKGQFDTIPAADDLIANEPLLKAALSLFQLDDAIYNETFLREVLTADVTDENAVINQLEDGRFAALSRAFGFGNPPVDGNGDPLLDANGDPVVEKSRLEVLVDTVNARDGAPQTADDFFNDPKLMLATLNLFNVPQGFEETQFTRRYLSSDPADPTSLQNVFADPRFRVLADVFNFQPPATERTYPAGFVEQITQNYLDQQFEIGVGNADQSMRIALALDDNLADVVALGSTNNTRWFAIMASNLLREVFETALGMPAGFGTLDIDQQLTEFEKRSQSVFGTSAVADFIQPDKLNEIRDRYLLLNSAQGFGTGGTSNGALTLLSSIRF